MNGKNLSSGRLIRKTESFCPQCIQRIPANIVEEEGKIYMVKECPQHGRFQVFLSQHPGYYRELNDFYFSLIKRRLPQRDYILRLTERCNLNCSICLASANETPAIDYPLKRLKAFIQGKRGYKFDLMGTEPTMREDLPQIIRMIHDSGNLAALHTNGIKIADFSYLKKLWDSGLKEVHFQFDGFDDQFYLKIRGQRLLSIKLKALENLKKLGIGTDLVATILRGYNDKEILKILSYGVANSFVREIFFLGCRWLGKARGFDYKVCLLPDEIIDLLTEQTKDSEEPITREEILQFQKLYFTLLSLISLKKCFYIHHYLLVRREGGYQNIHRILNLAKMESVLNRYKEKVRAGRRLARAFLLANLFPSLLRPSTLILAKDFLLHKSLLTSGFDISRIPPKYLLLGFISACDPYMYDSRIALNCGKGELSLDLGEQELGALANCLRDKNRLGK